MARGPLEAALLTLLRSRDRKPGAVSANNRPGNKETLPHVSGAAAPDSAKFPSRPDPGCDFMRTLPDLMGNTVTDGLADPQAQGRQRGRWSLQQPGEHSSLTDISGLAGREQRQRPGLRQSAQMREGLGPLLYRSNTRLSG